MNTVTLHAAGNITGMTPEQLGEMHADFAEYDIVRRVERWSIREFMRTNAAHLKGRVLDYGAGEEPYRGLVDGDYVAYAPERSGHALSYLANELIGRGLFDVVMSNQVVQYVPDPDGMLTDFARYLRPSGVLVMTFPTNWDEVEAPDLHRFTAAGMRRKLLHAGFVVTKMDRRAQVQMHNFRFPLGYGVVAVKA